jgi:SAM-dependent methyltransferase
LSEPKPSVLTNAKDQFLRDVYSIINDSHININYNNEQVSYDDLLRSGWNFSFQTGDAQDLTELYDNDTFDAVICSYLLCSVTNPQRVLHEIYRVLKTNRGVFGFVEHVAVEPQLDNGHEFLEFQQVLLDPLQQAVANNCHLHRYTEQTIQSVFGGQSFLKKDRFFVDEMWPVSCQMSGIIRKI